MSLVLKMLCYSYWAKTNYRERKNNPLAVKKRHLVPYHLLDVAASCKVLLDENPHYITLLSQILGEPEDVIKRWIIFYTALHDLPKISYEFQVKSPLDCEILGYPTCPSIALSDLTNKKEDIHHSHMGLGVWKYLIQEILEDKGLLINVNKRVSEDFFSAFASHHGAPSKFELKFKFNKRFKTNSQGFNDLEAIKELVLKLIEILNPPPLDLSKSRKSAIRKASWIINGIVNQADWLGSDMDYFGWVEKEIDLHEYWEDCKKTAKRRFTKSGLKAVPRKEVGFENLYKGWKPLPPQKWADTVTLHKEPSLFIIEAVTGSGKTETGLTLESRISELLGKKGIYFGLPTQGSAEKMFNRVLDEFCENAFEGVPTVALAHASSESNKRYKKIQSGNNIQYAKGTTTEFLSSSRKSALLAQVGVGTVDQLILSTLPRYHQSLRLTGLLNKVVIIDEIHSYQEYQQVILEKFLELAGEVGIPVIMLSATLNKERKRKLISAFLGREIKIALKDEYPLFTAVSKSKGIYAQDPDPPKNTLTPQLQWKMNKTITIKNVGIPEKDKCIQELIRRAERGECACWIRNTVENAKKTYLEIKEKVGPDIEVKLAHAKFTPKHRRINDEYAEKTFGAKSSTSDRAGKIVIATQVYEQSLDLDFDFMVTDLAPIEVLIQRIGRLCRHFRDSGNGEDLRVPEAWVFGPYFQSEPSISWLKQYKQISIVYGNVMNLWKTQREIKRSGSAWTFPTNSRTLIENVHKPMEIFEALKETMEIYEGELYSHECEGYRSRLDFELGWYEHGHENWRNNEVYTRLMDPTETFYLCEIKQGILTPFDAHNWNDCKVSIRRSVASRPKQDLSDLASKQNIGWLEKRGHFLEVRDGLVEVVDGNGKPKEMIYNSELGFVKK